MRKRDIPLLITGLLAMLAGIYIFLLPVEIFTKIFNEIKIWIFNIFIYVS